MPSYDIGNRQIISFLAPTISIVVHMGYIPFNQSILSHKGKTSQFKKSEVLSSKGSL